MSLEKLSYASPSMPPWQRHLVRGIEDLSGRRKLLPLYERWRTESASRSPRMMAEMLALIDTTLDIAGVWPPSMAPDDPLVMIANHPFGIGDGLALCVLAEALARPYRILVNKDFLRVPEVAGIVLPIDFAETEEAVRTNLATRAEARRLLATGTTLIIFPAGGVATANRLFGRAEELPWKLFTARLVQQARANVLPVYIEGQNSHLFQLVSRYSLVLRVSLLVSEFRRFVGSRVRLNVGAVVPHDALQHVGDRRALTDELYACVQRLAPGNNDKPMTALRPRPASERKSFPWEQSASPPQRRSA